MNKLPPILALSLLCGTAAADPEILSSTVVGDRIEMTIAGARDVRPEQFVLRDATTPRGEAVPATSVRDFAHGGDAVAIAIVYEGNEVWIGNDNIIPDEDPSRYYGALAGVRGAVDALKERGFPMGSEGSLISYDSGVQLRHSLGILTHVDTTDVGSQKDYYNHVGNDLVGGIDFALRQLRQSHAPIKALIVLGDGTDTNPDTAKRDLADLKKRAAREGIETFGVIYKGALSEPSSVVTAFAPSARTVNTLDDMATSVGSFLDRITDRTYATFRAPWSDGAQHAMIATIGGSDLDAEYVTAPYVAPSRFHWLGGYWQQLLAGVALVGLLALGMRIRAAKTV